MPLPKYSRHQPLLQNHHGLNTARESRYSPKLPTRAYTNAALKTNTLLIKAKYETCVSNNKQNLILGLQATECTQKKVPAKTAPRAPRGAQAQDWRRQSFVRRKPPKMLVFLAHSAKMYKNRYLRDYEIHWTLNYTTLMYTTDYTALKQAQACRNAQLTRDMIKHRTRYCNIPYYHYESKEFQRADFKVCQTFAQKQNELETFTI